jgi:hypothetical protein
LRDCTVHLLPKTTTPLPVFKQSANRSKVKSSSCRDAMLTDLSTTKEFKAKVTVSITKRQHKAFCSHGYAEGDLLSATNTSDRCAWLSTRLYVEREGIFSSVMVDHPLDAIDISSYYRTTTGRTISTDYTFHHTKRVLSGAKSRSRADLPVRPHCLRCSPRVR